MFGEKYDDEVRVVDVPGISMELCGGTHVKSTSELGCFKIISEEGISAGVRRIEALSGQSAFDYFSDRNSLVNSWIMENYFLDTKNMAKSEALEKGAVAMFGEKYDDEVRVVNVPGVSMELCGGTHVKTCLLYTSPSPRDLSTSRMPSSA